MIDPWFIRINLAASGTVYCPAYLQLIRTRTLSFTVRCTFGASGDDNLTVNVYYSPDGRNWDTIPYATGTVTLSAGNTVQRTFLIDAPEHGYMKIELVNESQADTISNIKVWYEIQAWMETYSYRRGAVTEDVTEEPTG